MADRIAKSTGFGIGDWKQATETQELVREWIAAGADEAMIVETVKGRLATAKQKPRRLSYFRDAVKDAVNDRKAASSQVTGHTDALIDRILKKDAA